MDIMLWTCRREEERRDFDIKESCQDRPPPLDITKPIDFPPDFITVSGSDNGDTSLSRPRTFVENSLAPPLVIQASASFSSSSIDQEEEDDYYDCDGTLDGDDEYKSEHQLVHEKSIEGWLFEFWDIVMVELCGFPHTHEKLNETALDCAAFSHEQQSQKGPFSKRL